MKLGQLSCLLGAIALFSSCAQAPDNEIRVGEYGSMTGETATFGQTTHDGIQLAVDEINASGGIKGEKVRLITEDDQGKAEEAAEVVNKLISSDKVHAILGEVASSNSLAAAPIAQHAGIPMISPSSTNPKVTQQGDYIFRVCFIDPFQGKVMSKFAQDSLHAKTAAILRDTSSDYSMGLADVFKAQFVAGGGSIVLDRSYQAQDVDFKSQLATIMERHPDVVFVPGYYTEVGLIAKQARDMGLNVPLLGGDGWESPQLYAIGGSSLDGDYYSTHCSPQSKDKVVVDFVAKYRAKYHEDPGALAMLGYDAARVLFDAIQRAPSLKGSDLRDAIAMTKNFQGVTGNITLDVNRDAIKSAVVLKIKDGASQYVSTINP